jgi:hypothetical protein
MTKKIKENLMLVDFDKIKVSSIEKKETKIKVDTEKYYYLLSKDSKNLYLVRKRFIGLLFEQYKPNVAKLDVEAKISDEELVVYSDSNIENAYFIDEDEYFLFADRKSIEDDTSIFISGYFEVSDELVELERKTSNEYVSLIDDSVKYAYKIYINDRFYIKINASNVNLKPGSKVKLYGRFYKNDYSYEDMVYFYSNDIDYKTQVQALEFNNLLGVFPYILNIRDFSYMNTESSKFDMTGFKIIQEEKKVEKDEVIDICKPLENKVVSAYEEITEDNSKKDTFWTFGKILLFAVGLGLLLAIIY